jgi:aryl-alcohol dehydrogenase-like predicted oxidoreductase
VRGVADRYSCDIATVASRVMLQREGVAAVIVGATNASHLDANARIGAVELDSDDLAAIDAVAQRHVGPEGDVFSLERDREGRHGRIMKYDLNK